MLSATVPRKSVGSCGTHAIVERHDAAEQSARSTSPAVTRPPSGSASSSSSEAIVLLPPPLGPTSATVSPGAELEVDAVEHRGRPRRVRERDALEPDARVARARRDASSRPGRDIAVDEVEQPLRDREPVGARVELRGEVPQRQVELGREHEHGQAASKPMPPSTRRTPTVTATSAIPSVAASSSTVPERNATRSVAIVVRRYSSLTSRDLLRLRLAAVERAQRRQPADDVEEVRREERQRLPALARALLACSGRSAT